MKTLVIGACAPDRVYRLKDPDAPYENEIEAAVIKVLSCLYPAYHCIVFGGGFEYEGRVSRPDLALVARDYSHWFIIEVELVSHSLSGHVLPQVVAFRYGAPQPDCARILERELGIGHSQARTLVEHVPRSVVVIANRRDPVWETSLAAHSIQFGVVSLFRTNEGTEAIEWDGTLTVLEKNLGFGSYSAVDRSLRFPVQVALPDGPVQIADAGGSPGTWLVTRDERFTWITKERGTPAIMEGASVQLRLSYDGAISLKIPGGR
ncbi:hypothetical protein L2U69_13425 [Zavarzinia compransoris]|uniref:hypothetical protein n=1 Tax=Zavarzinia marina TaxID=2911065 RepID=UPI001F3E1085|nr:hypothetical protein [Zavarzinia marina]MCF4166648.1 hypothetical protein [Zavarzinia marina]